MQKAEETIKCGFCVAYDWELLCNAIPPVYQFCDIIVIAVDKNCVSWNGVPFLLDEALFTNFIKEIDQDNKIKIYRDNFYVSGLSAVENEVRQRNMVAEMMGKSGWHLQLDADEYMLNPEVLFETIRRVDSNKPVTIRCQWITLFKQTGDGFFLIKNSPSQTEYVPVATNNPVYVYGRNNRWTNIYINCLILHQSWARTEQEVMQKINSWGHTNDADFTGFRNAWLTLSKNNYRIYKNFHPLRPAIWKSLLYVEGSSVKELITRLDPASFKVPEFYLALKNSKLIARLKQFLNV